MIMLTKCGPLIYWNIHVFINKLCHFSETKNLTEKEGRCHLKLPFNIIILSIINTYIIHNLPGGVCIWSCDSSLYGSRLVWGCPPLQSTWVHGLNVDPFIIIFKQFNSSAGLHYTFNLNPIIKQNSYFLFVI